jgi:hypothetical protein
MPRNHGIVNKLQSFNKYINHNSWNWLSLGFHCARQAHASKLLLVSVVKIMCRVELVCLLYKETLEVYSCCTKKLSRVVCAKQNS